MRINHALTVPAPVDQVWEFLGHVAAVTECLPGAELTNRVDESNYQGLIKATIGPLPVHYTGTVAIAERDESRHTMTLNASGRDRRGSGTATAEILARLTPADGETRLQVASQLRLTGRVAALATDVEDVTKQVFAEFARNVAAEFGQQQSHAVDIPTAHPSPVDVGGAQTPVKVSTLILTGARKRLANWLLRLSRKVRP